MVGIRTDLTGRLAVVTGSSKGLGAETAKILAAQGAGVVLTYHSDEAKALAVAATIAARGGTAHVQQLDMGSIDSIQQFFGRLRDGPGSPDIFVANAATTAFKNLIDQRPHNVERTFNISVNGFLEAARQCVPAMTERGRGRLVAVSGADTRGWGPTHGLLAAAKAAMEMMVKYLQVELSGTGVSVIGVNPDAFHSDGPKLMFGDLYESTMAAAGMVHPYGRVAEPAEMAEIVALACTDAATWMAGTTIDADGGAMFAKAGKIVELAFRLPPEQLETLIEQMTPTPLPRVKEN
jgi:NAD(P)-dependent dehydrogenase (short-subunit alcohol dehydrogenase family)